MESACCSRAMLPFESQRPAVVGRQVQLRTLHPACSSLRPESSKAQLGRRLQRQGSTPAVEPSAAVGATATELASSRLGTGALSSSPCTSSRSTNGNTLVNGNGRPSRLRVAVDVDEVLGRFLHSLNKFCFEEYGMEYEVSDYHVYDFAKVWTCSQDESNHKVHEFFKSHHFAAGIETIPGAYDSLLRLRSACDLMVVTSRQHVIQEPTLEWLQQHFPKVFDEVHFGNHFALEGKSRKKSEICRAIGAEVLIDDNPAYAVECAAAGIHVLLYDWQHAYPWSKTQDGPVHDRITRVRDWLEVEQVLGVLAATRGAGQA